MDLDLDLEGMYRSFQKNVTRKDVLDTIQVCFATLETLVGILTKAYIEKKDPTKKLKSVHTFRRKLEYLKSKEAIPEELYHNLGVLSRIRNKLFHKLFANKTIFNDLSDITCDVDFINGLENDSRKYQLLTSYCAVFLHTIADKIAPRETLHLEATEETKFVPVKDDFS